MNQVERRVAVNKLTPILMVEDVAAAVRFYEEVLDFKRTATVPEKEPFVFAVIENGGVEVMLQEPKSFVENIEFLKGKKAGGTVALYMDIVDIDALYERAAKKTKIVKELHETFYGTREFYMLDCSGYILGFAEKQ